MSNRSKQTETPAAVDKNEGVDTDKRDFLRKAGYTAPIIVTLGAAAHSGKVMAQFTGPPSAPAPNSVDPEDDPVLDAIEEQNNTD